MSNFVASPSSDSDETMQHILTGKNILLGVCGGIASYKVCDWVRTLKRAEAVVTVVMTASAQKFVTPLTFAALSGNRVSRGMFDEQEAETIPHIRLGQEADLILIAPATAQTISRAAHGFADDLLASTLLAARCPIVFCPAMNSQMYLHDATQHNIEKLRSYGHTVVAPAIGEMACGDSGPGRLPEWNVVLANIAQHFSPQDLNNHKILITAGPTEEPLDPVRYISNRSSGKMGYALARAASLRGAKVTLISGPTALADPPGIEMIRVRTAEEMFQTTIKNMPGTTIVIKAAAVSDFKPASYSHEKIKKGAKTEQLSLTATKDILRHLGDNRSGTTPTIVGFAAESRNHTNEGLRKLKGKSVDLIVVNDIKSASSGFQVDTNKVTILDKNGGIHDLPLMSKDQTAGKILDAIVALK